MRSLSSVAGGGSAWHPSVTGDTSGVRETRAARRTDMTGRPENSPNPQDPSTDRGVLDEALEPEQIRSLNSALRKLTETEGVSSDLQDAEKKLQVTADAF